MQAPHVFAQRLIPQDVFSAFIGFVPGGTLRGYTLIMEQVLEKGIMFGGCFDGRLKWASRRGALTMVGCTYLD